MATLNLPCVWGQSTAFVGIPTNTTTSGTEQPIAITVRPGYAVDIMFTCTAAWNYRTTTGVSTNDMPVAASQPLTIRFYQNITIYPVQTDTAILHIIVKQFLLIVFHI